MIKLKEIKFKDAEFLTAKEKEHVYKDFVKFVENGFQIEQFTKKLYDHLHLHCGFIAHYDKTGFYANYFKEPEDTKSFMEHFDRDNRNFNNYILHGDYEDITTAFCDFIDDVKSSIYERCRNSEKVRDVETAMNLLKKHSVKFTIEDIVI